jgi:Sec-independent protein translocase protein TatA
LIIIAVVALMLFSPKELPGIIRTFTKFWGSLRATADDFKDAIMNEEELDEIKKAMKGGKEELKKVEATARRELMKARVEMQKAQNKLIKTVKASEQAQKQEAIGPADGSAPEGAAAAVGAAPAGTPAAASPAATTAPAEAAATPTEHATAPSNGAAPPEATVDPVAPEGTVAHHNRPGPPPIVKPPSPKPGDGVDQGAA